MDLNQIVKDVALSKVCSIKLDKDSETSKTVTLNVRFDGVALKDVFTKAVSSTVIQWQNGPGRNGFDKWTPGQVVNVDFKAPGRTVETREDKIAKYVAAGMNPEIAAFAVDNPESFAKAVNSTVEPA